jgi:hypothetical protein
VYECPLPNTPPLVVQTSPSTTSATSSTVMGQLSLSTSVPPFAVVGPEKDYLCLLSLLVPSDTGDGNSSSIRQPVARSYGGRAWEVKAGPFAETVAPPVCDDDDNGTTTCLFTLPLARVAGGEYILTSYSYGGGAR